MSIKQSTKKTFLDENGVISHPILFIFADKRKNCITTSDSHTTWHTQNDKLQEQKERKPHSSSSTPHNNNNLISRHSTMLHEDTTIDTFILRSVRWNSEFFVSSSDLIVCLQSDQAVELLECGQLVELVSAGSFFLHHLEDVD